MSFYARRPSQLLGQLTADLFMIAWIVLWWIAGRAASVRSMRSPPPPARPPRRPGSCPTRSGARRPGRPGARPRSELRKPIDDAAGSLQSVITATDQQVATIERRPAARLAGVLHPGLILLVIWLPARVRFFRRARAAQRFLDAQADLDLFALRAMAAQPMHLLAKISDDPVQRWRQGDRQVINSLAALELRRSGLATTGLLRSRVAALPHPRMNP